ncbi:GATA zinc finger domain-containing protein 10-like [Cottoperca gobio]|uniref:GATA zinc finger domain-containing protein 10-like n=1 Tax=Cottoperca gobio TaxID=56716 RepID=A0A6J2R380_COTGO|nr:GATA zinc finger domain-containing protein 10-like [Cottoperca gobio]
MSVHTSQKTTTSYRTVNVASPEPVTSTVISTESVSPSQYGINGSYETVRYLVPMQQQQQQQLQQQHTYLPVQQQQHTYLPVQQQQHSYIPVQQAVQQHSYIPVQQAVQQQQSYVLMQQQPMMQQQPLMQHMVSPVYLHSMPHLSVSSQESSDLTYQQHSVLESISGKSSSVFSAEEEMKTLKHKMNTCKNQNIV